MSNYIIIGIDFGTTGSSFGIKRIGKSELGGQQNISEVIGEEKIPTILLVDRNFEILAWGNGALDKYSEVYNKTRRNLLTKMDFLILKDFKLALRGRDSGFELRVNDNDNDDEEEEGEVDLDLDFEDIDFDDSSDEGLELIRFGLYDFDFQPLSKKRTLELMGKYLGLMKVDILESLMKIGEVEGKTFIWKEDVKIVVSVPATFLEEEKKLYEHAFRLSGLFQEDQSFPLFFVHEPLAAGLSMIGRHPDPFYVMKKGDVMLVLDCGGGTVDITTHICKDSKKWIFEEVCYCEGRNCGSEFVTLRFKKWFVGRYGLASKAGLGGIDSLGLSSEFFFLEEYFNKYVKNVYDGNNNNNNYKIRIGSQFKTKHLANYLAKESVNNDGKQYPYLEVQKRGRRVVCVTLTLKHEIVEGFFKEPLKNIAEALESHVRTLGSKSIKIKRFYCVGGFMKSRALFTATRLQVEQPHWSRYKDEGFKLIRAEKEAVLMGTVLLGLYTNMIPVKRSARTYGIQTRIEKSSTSNNALTKDVFMVFLEKDSPVSDDLILDQKFKNDEEEDDDEEESLEIKIYSSSKKPLGVMYMDDPSVRFEKSFLIPLNVEGFSHVKKIVITISFKGDEMLFKVLNHPQTGVFCTLKCKICSIV